MDGKNLKKASQYYWLDLIRGLSAVAVFAGHLRVMCFSDSIDNSSSVQKIFFFLTGFGHISVTIFFVLSGFLIIRSINEAVIKNSWSLKNYARDRLIRLWIVLIPCLLLGIIFDKLGLQYWHKSLLYSNHLRYFTHPDLTGAFSLQTFIGNAFFLQTILVPVLGFNGPLWTLAYEFWYYVVFPLFYFAAINYYTTKYRIVVFITGVLVLLFLGNDILLKFPWWFMGGLSYIVSKKIKKTILQNKVFLFSLLILFFTTITLLRLNILPNIFNNYSLALLFSLFIPFLINTEMPSNLIKTISKYLSNISYTLYLSHLPFNIFITSVLGFQNRNWSSHNFIMFLILTVATLLYSASLWFIFERNTKKIKGMIFSKREQESVRLALKPELYSNVAG